MINKMYYLIFLLILVVSQKLLSQATVIPNAGINTNYVGWNSAQSFPLWIKHEALQPIYFYTNAGTTAVPANMRMKINSTYNVNDGLIGIGDMTTGFTQGSQLHQHRNGTNSSMYHQFTTGNTGILSLDGFRIGLTYTAPVTWVDIMQQEDAPIRISTGNNNIAPSQMLERMRFTTGLGGDGVGNWNTIANATKINISSGGIATVPFNFPVACLNIGYDLPGNASGGRRPWMDIGTYYSSNSDHMYTGLLDMGSNRKDAIVNFGDDPQYNAFDNSVQNLRFIFTQWPETPANNGDPYNPTRTQGLEIARMSAQGNMGIGSLFANTLQPARRLEIVDDGITHGAHFGGPQLRLSHVQANAVDISNTGIWTDFQTTNLGDLYIHPSDNATYRRVGINTSTPGNSLEINAVGINGTHTYGVGLSGLRFADMNNTSPSAVAGTYNKFLTVDPSGDVVLSDLPPSSSPVTICGAGLLTNFLTKATATNEICRTIVEEYSSHDIGIGSPANLARLNVWADAVVPQQRALYIRNYQTLYDGQPKYGMEGFVKAKNNDEAWGIRMYVESDNNICVGAEFSAKCFGTGASASSFGARLLSKGVGIQNCGAYVEANDAITNYGINAIVKSIPGITTDNYGGSFYAEHASVNNYGVSAASEFGTYTYGIKANASLGTNCYGVYGSASSGGFNAAGYFSGDCWAVAFPTISDSIFKSNITNISSAITVINQLSPKSYNFDFQKYPYMNFPKTKQYGLIAQDVEKILPSLVSVGVQPASIDSLGNPIKELQFKGVNYIELIPILIQAVKEQQTQITNLQNQINSCCSVNNNSNKTSHTITTKLTDIETIILDQNEPNPFAEETNISYFIPESAGKAELMFYTNDGRLINKVEIKEKGQGTLHIYASDLSSGIYTYTLMVNGKVVETRKMMKAK